MSGGGIKSAPSGNSVLVNLLYTLTTYPPSIGGAQLHQHQLARQFLGRHVVQVASHWDTPRSDWLLGTTVFAPRPARRYEIDGVPVERIALPSEALPRLWPWVIGYYLVQGPALARIAAVIAEQIAPFAAQADLVHNVRIGREGLSFASLNVARQRGIPFILTPVHHPRWSGWLHRYYQKLYRLADAVIALTEAERQTLIRLGVAEQRVFVTGHGPVLAEAADGDRFRAAHRLESSPMVLFLGQKYAYKGFETLLAAAPLVWKRLPETVFAFVGPRTTASQKRFQSVTDRRIVELDAVSLEEKTDALAACDLLCLPSTQESFGGVFTEAWSFRKPVIGCNIPAVRSVVENERDGLLVSQTPAELADAILLLLTRPDLSVAMGQAGYEKVARLYTWPRLAEKTERVYLQTLAG
jgi:glycosyltransferase involved in cell wall biosynthesis